MQLRELSSLTSMPIASIKFYLREGLLPPGHRVTATRSDYDELHVRRIATIQALRNVNDLSVAQIREIVGLIDAGASRVEIMKSLQREIQSLGEPVPGRTEAGNAIVALRGWPDVPSAARGALDDHLEEMERLGVPLPPAALDVYSQAVDLIAHVDLEDAAAAENLDALVARVAVGMHMHRQLVLKLLALAQTSRSIAVYGQAPGRGQPPAGPAGPLAGPLAEGSLTQPA